MPRFFQAEKVQANEQRQRKLHGQLDFRRGSQAALLRDLRVIVVEAERGKHEHRKQCKLHERVPLRPQHGGQIHRGHDENPAHRRRAFFAEHARHEASPLFRPVHVLLPELQSLESRDDLGPKPPTHEQRCHRRAHAAKRDVLKHAQARQPIGPFCSIRCVKDVLAQIVKHYVRLSLRRSSPVTREALTKMTSPSRVNCFKTAVASATLLHSVTWRSPAARAACAMSAAIFPTVISSLTPNSTVLLPISECAAALCSPNSAMSPRTAMRRPRQGNSWSVCKA